MREKELLLYRDFENGKTFYDFAWLMGHEADASCDEGRLASVFYAGMHDLLELAGSRGFYGNLWHCYLTDLLVNHENSYSCSCELIGDVSGSVGDAALHDLAIFKEFFDYDFAPLVRRLRIRDFSLLTDYRASDSQGRVYNLRVRDRICQLAKNLGEAGSPEVMRAALAQFYRGYGVGKFGLHKAFYVSRRDGEAQIEPILRIAHIRLDDLVGYEIPKKKLVENTEAFVEGRRANNCLLFGDAGTGKSSCVKALANAYYDRGLRVIEIYKHQFQHLGEVIGQIKDRHYKFIIFMDDLSFEDFEVEYKYLKAVIEGGLEKKPDNVLIYATSNRRHLVRENFSDREEGQDDLHRSDTVQEKLSLVSRFGVTIYFGAPDQKEYDHIVSVLADRQGVRLCEDKLLALANQWELAHGGPSGRTAQQFIDYLLGQRRE